MRSVFLIQASGDTTENYSPATTFAEEPIEHGFYDHSNWHNQSKDEDFGEVSEGDQVLLYSTGNVDEAPKQIKYVFRVDGKGENRPEGEEVGVPNRIHLEQIRKLSPGFPLDKIRQWVEDGNLSDEMNRAGTQGFNITEVATEDCEAILEWAEEHEPEPAIEHYEEELRTFVAGQGLDVVRDQYSGYELYQDAEGGTGELYTTPVGEIDLLYKNPDTGDFVVVELKRTRDTSDKVVGQISRYLGWVDAELAGEEDVHGLIVAQTASQRLQYAVQALSDCHLSTYRLNFEFSNSNSTLP